MSALLAGKKSQLSKLNRWLRHARAVPSESASIGLS